MKIKIIHSLPVGWVYTKNCSTAPIGYSFVSNNKSRFKQGREIALIKIDLINN